MPKAIVFTHFTVPRDAQPIDFPPNRRIVAAYCRKRIRMYARCDSIGLVYVFMAEGYQAILGAKRPWEGLEAERVLREHLENAVDRLPPGQKDKIQIVGTHELKPTMAHLSRMAARAGFENLGDVLLGSGGSLQYDSPKVVEAMVRLARAVKFRKEPIFRFDADVEIDEANLKKLLEYYVASKGSRYYFFSGGYRCRNPKNEAEMLLNSYAVRVAQFCDEAGGMATLDIGKAKQFLNDLPAIGGDPYNQVISGAGLCMSPEAIRALPPFANVGEAIIWIDDHLKRILHEDMGHIRPRRYCSRCENARFVQHRYDKVSPADVHWHGHDYLKRLVRGCLLDAMIQDRGAKSCGLVAAFVNGYIPTGFRPPKAFLEARLSGVANDRLGMIKKTWQEEAYLGSTVHDFAQTELTGGSGAHLVGEAIEAVDSYFALLEIWSQFVGLCEQIDRRLKANRWLFRPVP